jgi:pyruvate kinase
MSQDHVVELVPQKKTKIVATLGPATQSQEVLEQLIANGMDIHLALLTESTNTRRLRDTTHIEIMHL